MAARSEGVRVAYITVGDRVDRDRAGNRVVGRGRGAFAGGPVMLSALL